MKGEHKIAQQTVSRSVVLLAVLLAGVSAVPAHAQQQSQAAGTDGNLPPSSDIIVTGTRRTERTATQSLSPIDVVSAGELAATPASNLNDRLAASVPSFNVQSLPGVDTLSVSKPAALRNLNPDQTLVLVNGHRRHRSAYVDTTYNGSQAIDLGQIPSAAIGRIEVLRDGASAQYGSDAIAGVINLILNDKPGTTLSAQVGQYYAGDGFGVQLDGRSGFALPGGGSLSFAGDYNKSNETDRSVGVRNKIGQPDLETYHATYDLTLPFGNGWQGYSYGTYGHSSSLQDFRFRTTSDPIYGRSFYQSGPNAIYPTYNLTSVYPDGFANRFGAVVRDGEIRAGVKGEVADKLSLEIGGGYGRNSIDYKTNHSINASLGPLSPTSFDAGEIVSTQADVGVDAAYLLDAGLAKPVSIAFGGSYTNEGFQSIAGDVASYVVGPLADLPGGSSGHPGLTPADAGKWSRDSEAGYLDVEGDLTSRLTLGAAGRYEHFSDFGSNFSYKFSGRFQAANWAAIRATYNTGFHAPAPGQSHFVQTTTAPDATKPVPFPIVTIGLVSPTNPLAAPFGGQPLKPEKSKNVSAGVVLTPSNNVTLTVDYYHINIRNRIAVTSQVALAPGQPYNYIQFLINGYDTNSGGLDVVGSWTQRLGGGRATLTAAYNYNRTIISNAIAALPLNVLRPIAEDARPHHTAIVTGTYDLSKLHVTSRLRYYGSYVDALPVALPPGFQLQKLSPRALVDLSVSYDVLPRTQLTVGAQNLLGTYPERTAGIERFLGYKYPIVRPYDADGGFWYVRLTQKFQ